MRGSPDPVCQLAPVSDPYLPAQPSHEVFIGLAAPGVGEDGALVLLALRDVEHRNLVRFAAAITSTMEAEPVRAQNYFLHHLHPEATDTVTCVTCY